MLAAYPKLGKALFPRNAWRESLVGDEFADVGRVRWRESEGDGSALV